MLAVRTSVLEKQLDSVCILKVEPAGFANWGNVKYEKTRVKGDSECLAWATDVSIYQKLFQERGGAWFRNVMFPFEMFSRHQNGQVKQRIRCMCLEGRENSRWGSQVLNWACMDAFKSIELSKVSHMPNIWRKQKWSQNWALWGSQDRYRILQTRRPRPRKIKELTQGKIIRMPESQVSFSIFKKFFF